MRKLTAICDSLERVLGKLLTLLVALLLVVVVMQVGGRLFLHTPPLWTIDAAALLLVWSVFIGAAVVFRTDEHFVIDIWPKRHKKLYTVVLGLSSVAVILIMSILAFDGIRYAYISRLRLSGMVQMPMSYFIAAIPFGLVFSVLFSLERLLRVLNEPTTS